MELTNVGSIYFFGAVSGMAAVVQAFRFSGSGKSRAKLPYQLNPSVLQPISKKTFSTNSAGCLNICFRTM